MSIDLIAATLILAFAAVVVLGHVLVIAAICRILREDHGGRCHDNGQRGCQLRRRRREARRNYRAAACPCFRGSLAFKIHPSPPNAGPRVADRGGANVARLERSETRGSPPTRVAPGVASLTPATCYARG